MKPRSISLSLITLFASTSIGFSDTQKPNIIVVLSDDQGYADLGCSEFAKDDVKTPNLDKLAAEGVRFTQAYSTAPICNASRAGLITGVHQARMGVFWYKNPGISKDYETIPESLKKAGYATNPKYPALLIQVIKENDLHKYDMYSLEDVNAKEEDKEIVMKNKAVEDSSLKK